MVATTRLLCGVLTIWFVVSRPSATNPSGSPDSGWWGAKESAELQKLVRRQIAAGDFAAAEATFQQGLRGAERYRDDIARARYLSGIASTRLARFDYRGALNAYLEAKRAASAAADRVDLGAIDSNLATLYQQIWDLRSAAQASDEALEAIAGAEKVPYYAAALLLQSGKLHQDRGDADPVPFYERGIEAAWRAEQGGVEANAWDLLGRRRVASGDLNGAEQAFLRGYYIRRLHLARDLGLSYFWLGSVRLARAEAVGPGPAKEILLDDAARLTRRALEESARGAVSISEFLSHQQQGRILLARGDVPAALRELGQAVDLAQLRLAGIPLAGSLLEGATAEIERAVVRTFVETAVDYGIATNNSKWIENAFLVEERNRAANFESGETLAEAWRTQLPPEFLDILGKLRAEEARGIGSRTSKTNRLKLELTEMESGLDSRFRLFTPENFLDHKSLILFEHGLGENDLVLSFEVGNHNSSFLWAATAKTLRAYRLPAVEQIRRKVEDFRVALEDGRAEAQGSGKGLYTMLFGQLTSEEAQKSNWLVSPDDVLRQLPFAALSLPGGEYLVERHTVTIAAGAFSRQSASAEDPRPTRFMAIGDPIYNPADLRWTGVHHWTWTTHAAETQLNRLPGSGREVELSARGWQDALVLEGPAARKDRFMKELASSRPDVIHLATHVVTDSRGAEAVDPVNETFLAFGIGSDARPELLGTTEIAMLRVPGSLVLMTGCASAVGDARSSLGLENLARAWTLAGASAVIATLWPVRDSTGSFLEGFYRNLRGDLPSRSGTAKALRQTQIQAIHAGVVPAEWASYQVFGGMR